MALSPTFIVFNANKTYPSGMNIQLEVAYTSKSVAVLLEIRSRSSCKTAFGSETLMAMASCDRLKW